MAFLECVRSIKYADGHVFTADLRQVKVHEVANTPKLLWEEEIGKSGRFSKSCNGFWPNTKCSVAFFSV